MVTHFRILAWSIPWTEVTWWITVHRIAESDTTEVTKYNTQFSYHSPWESHWLCQWNKLSYYIFCFLFLPIRLFTFSSFFFRKKSHTSRLNHFREHDMPLKQSLLVCLWGIILWTLLSSTWDSILFNKKMFWCKFSFCVFQIILFSFQWFLVFFFFFLEYSIWHQNTESFLK